MHWNDSYSVVCLSRVCVAIATEDQHVVVAVVKFIHMVTCVLRTNYTYLILLGASLLSLNTDRARITGCGP